MFQFINSASELTKFAVLAVESIAELHAAAGGKRDSWNVYLTELDWDEQEKEKIIKFEFNKIFHDILAKMDEEENKYKLCKIQKPIGRK